MAGAEERRPPGQGQPQGSGLAANALGVSLLALILVGGAEPLHGQTLRSGNAVTSVQQQGGTRPSRSEVTRYPDGHGIRTRDGRSTDLSIQRRVDPHPRIGAGASHPSSSQGAPPGPARFQYPGRTADGAGADQADPAAPDPWSATPAPGRADLRRHLLERMGVGFQFEHQADPQKDLGAYPGSPPERRAP